jgi:hypothetical protein
MSRASAADEAHDLGSDSGSAVIVAKTEMYLGAIASDRGNFMLKADLSGWRLFEAARAAGEVRMEMLQPCRCSAGGSTSSDLMHEDAARYLDLSLNCAHEVIGCVHAVAGRCAASRTGGQSNAAGLPNFSSGPLLGLSAWRSLLGLNLGTRPR